MKKAKLFLFFILIFLLQNFIFSSPSFATSNKLTTYSPSCILMEANTGKILYEKNSNEIRYPASTTKIMTAILAVEHCNLSDIATVSHNAVFSVPPTYMHANLQEGEELTIEDLLHVLLIPSANDAANVLAEHISGSIEEFAKLMNEKAKEIGCLNTHFLNPSGIHDTKHTSTAHDLALMGKYAMQNDTIRRIVKKTNCSLPATNKYSKTDRYFNTSNDLLRENVSSYYYEGTIGIKTGYTSDAGNCIIAGAQRNGLEVIAVVLGGGTTSNGYSERYLDCKTLFDYAFKNYSIKTLHEKNSILQQIVVKGAKEENKNLNILVEDDLSVFLDNATKIEDLNPEITIKDDLRAPVAANSVVGTISYNIDGKTYSSNLIAETTVPASGFLPIMFRILLIFIVLYLLYVLLRSSKKTDNKKKKHNSKSKKGGQFKFTNINHL